MYHWSTFLVPEDVLMEPVFTGVPQSLIGVSLHFSINYSSMILLKHV